MDRSRVVARSLGAAILVVLGALKLVGCTGQDPSSPTPTPSLSAPVAGAHEQSEPTGSPDATIKDPLGPCRETETTVYPPSDHEELCTYRRMVVGHTLPQEGTTYLSRIVPDLKVGSLVAMGEQLWEVSEISSIPKQSLPDEMYTPEGRERYLVTCDPDSGYALWPDGVMHTRNNLIVTLVEA